ncbi:MAG: RNA polymerase sigma factor [Bacteroidales bacterium]|nr:RNA polymerase sigma factor [Bacteroidales bacterium]MBN2762333.1 RNA polymerase sigma factor [Bacteroidales bacterium]
MAEKNGSGQPVELINKCRKGDRKAQFELYRLYYKAMYNTSLRIVAHPAEAEDIMQEAFLSAFAKINTYKGDVSFGAWLKKIVINKSIDALRQRKMRFDELSETKSIEIQEESIGFPDDDNQSPELMIKRIKNAIQELPHGYQVVITLALIEGYDHEEIAKILAINESTSRSQLTRARKKLIEIIKSKQK